MSHRTRSDVLRLCSCAAVVFAASLMLACQDAPGRPDGGDGHEASEERPDGGNGRDAGEEHPDGGDGRDAGEEHPDASVALGPPCEKTQGVCAGAVHARLGDGGFEPVCTSASYGPDYEGAETRCDGLDNDCDGETDRHWVTVHPRDIGGTWNAPATRVDAGFVVYAFERGPHALRRLNDRLEPLAPPEELQLPGAGYLDATRLFPTRSGVALTYVRRDFDNSTTTAYLAQLSPEGTALRGEGGEPLVSTLVDWNVQFGSLHATASPDGTRVMAVFPGSDAGTPPGLEPSEVNGVVTDEQGNIATAPTHLMRARTESSSPALYVQDIVSDEQGFVIAASEGSPDTPHTLRLQRFSSTLEPIGEERALEVNGEPAARLASEQTPTGERRPALAYRDFDAEGGVTRVRVLRNLFDGGQPETWAEVSPGVPWLGFQGTARGLQLAWKEQTYCAECESPDTVGAYRGRVFARSETSGIVELTPGSGELLFDGFSRPGVNLTPGPEGWMTFFLPVMNDGGVELRAVSYCTP